MKYNIFNLMTKEASIGYGTSPAAAMESVFGVQLRMKPQGRDKTTGDALFRIGGNLYRVEAAEADVVDVMDDED